jgi:S-DNA-T family DNA segregation ATPase FtsK/SpoIIIE
VLWLLTGSPFALAFAALGPIVALATVFDGRRQTVAAVCRNRAERAAALEALRLEVSRRHVRERALAWQLSPGAGRVLRQTPGAAWHGHGHGNAAGLAAVVLGRGEGPSTVRIGGRPADAAERALLRDASRLSGVPILVDPSAGIGFVGPPALARAAARAVVLQLAQHLTPGDAAIEVPCSPEWAWAGGLPHRSGDGTVVVSDSDGAHAMEAGGIRADRFPWRLATARSIDRLPPGLSAVLRVESPAYAVLERAAGRAEHRALVPDLLSTADAAAWAAEALAAAERAGLATGSRAIPVSVPFETLDQPAMRRADRSTLEVAVGLGVSGPVLVDLVGDGPHALIAGTSGSGKSEFLLAWLAALAAVHPPELVAMLLVDFKGGAAFEPMRGLPHVAGIVTDLDEAEAVRAMESLRAELRHREEVLRDAGVREIGTLAPGIVLPRLVIVIDEFQAMVERFPDLAPLIADIAARGRSLGVHLVLAAQRPNGVVRENVTANCGLRVSLRVLHRADSLAVLGVGDAAELDAACPGRAILARDGGAVEFQSALVSAAELERRRRVAVGGPVRRPWLDPLPSVLAPSDLAPSDLAPSDLPPADLAPGPVSSRGGEYVFGLADEPDRQRRSLAGWEPHTDGPVLVVGATGSGRTTALGALAWAFAERHGAHAVTVLGGPPSTEWDLVHDELARVRRGGPQPPGLLIVDELDARYRSWPEDARLSMVEALAALVQEGRAAGLHVAASATAARSLPLAVRDGFGSAIVLRHATRADLVQAGGLGELWRADDPPGSGQWRGRRIQIVHADRPRLPEPREVPRLPLLSFGESAPTAIVSATPAIDAELLGSVAYREPLLLRPGSDTVVRALAAIDGSPAPIVVGDADAWAANWSLLAAIRERGALVVHAGPAELRSVTRERTTPPVLDPGRSQCWLLDPGGSPRRFAWPSAPPDARNPQYPGRNGAESASDVPRN